MSSPTESPGESPNSGQRVYEFGVKTTSEKYVKKTKDMVH